MHNRICKGIVKSVDESNRITVSGDDGEFYHSAGKSYNELSKTQIYINPGDLVEFETGEDMEKYHITKVKTWRVKEMRSNVLNAIEKIKEMRIVCVQRMECIAADSDYTTSGKCDRMNTCIEQYHNDIITIVTPVLESIKNNIESITDEENKILLKKRASSDYAVTLDSTVNILADNAKNLSDDDIKATVSIFNNDPLAVQAIKKALKGSGKDWILPEDTRGTRQEYLKKTEVSLRSAVEMLASVTYNEEGFTGSTKVNDFYISNQALVMFDMAFVESLNDDCTGKRHEQSEKPENTDFGFDFTRIR